MRDNVETAMHQTTYGPISSMDEDRVSRREFPLVIFFCGYDFESSTGETLCLRTVGTCGGSCSSVLDGLIGSVKDEDAALRMACPNFTVAVRAVFTLPGNILIDFLVRVSLTLANNYVRNDSLIGDPRRRRHGLPFL